MADEIQACKLCYMRAVEYVEEVKDHEEGELEKRARHILSRLHTVEDPKQCEVPFCVSSSLNEAVRDQKQMASFERFVTSLAEDGNLVSGRLPVSRGCRNWLKKHASAQQIDGQKVSRWADLSKRLEIVDSEDECLNPWCPEAREHQTDEAKEHSCSAQSDPTICDCTCLGMRAEHIKVLHYIGQLEELNEQLLTAHGVKATLRAQAKMTKEVDMAVPPDGSRGKRELLGHLLVDLKLDGDKIEGPKGRPLTPVWCKNDYHCHIAKINRYAPANCDCTPTVCSCSHCVLAHVEHSVEDYEDAIARVRLGMTKLRAMPRTETGPMPTAPSDLHEHGGCAMPGVRRAKHLNNFAKSKKQAHNKQK